MMPRFLILLREMNIIRAQVTQVQPRSLWKCPKETTASSFVSNRIADSAIPLSLGSTLISHTRNYVNNS